jgi:hypothetical protein
MTGRTRGSCPSGKGSVVHIHHVMTDVSSVQLNPSRDFGLAMGLYLYTLSFAKLYFARFPPPRRPGVCGSHYSHRVEWLSVV